MLPIHFIKSNTFKRLITVNSFKICHDYTDSFSLRLDVLTESVAAGSTQLRLIELMMGMGLFTAG